MKLASEFIAEIQALIDEHGDQSVVMPDDTEPTVEADTDEADIFIFVIS